MDLQTSKIINTDSRHIPLPDACAHVAVTSPPYFNVRDYGHKDQLGREQTVSDYILQMVAVFREVRRVLRDDGTVWLNIGTTCQAGQDLQIPHRLLIALADDGWRVISDVIWHKQNTVPSAGLRSPSRYHEHVFVMAKKPDYYYDHLAVMAEGKTGLAKRLTSVWPIAVAGQGQNGHPAIMPEALVEVCVMLGSADGGCCPTCGAPYERITETGRALIQRKKDKDIKQPITDTLAWQPSCDCDAGAPVPCLVVDPFAGSGTVPSVSHRLGRVGIGIELNPEYCLGAKKRLAATTPVTIPPAPPTGFCYAPDACVPKPRTPKQQYRYAHVEIWAEIFPFLKKSKPNSTGGRPRESDRKALDGILTHLLEGVPWRRLPADVCVGMTALRRLKQWEGDGTWKRILPVLQDRYPELRMPDAA